MRSLQIGCLLLLCPLLSACAAFTGDDTEATMAAENVAFSTEAVLLVEADLSQRTQTAATLTAGQATLAAVQGANQQLAATLQGIVTPTPERVVDNTLDGTIVAEFAGQRYFQKTGMTRAVNPGDGCAQVSQATFSTADARIYATARVQNIEAGVSLASEWYYEGEQVYAFDFMTEVPYDEWCFYFYITPDIVEFVPGSWSVRLFADSFQLEDAMTFIMEAP